MLSVERRIDENFSYCGTTYVNDRFSTSAPAQVLEMAAKCDKLQKDLAEVIKKT